LWEFVFQKSPVEFEVIPESPAYEDKYVKQGNFPGRLTDISILGETKEEVVILMTHTGHIEFEEHEFDRKFIFILKNCFFKSGGYYQKHIGGKVKNILCNYDEEIKAVRVQIEFHKKQQSYMIIQREKEIKIIVSGRPRVHGSGTELKTARYKKPFSVQQHPIPEKSRPNAKRHSRRPKMKTARYKKPDSLHLGNPGSEVRWRQRPVPEKTRTEMKRYSWRPGCPVSIDDLACLKVSHWGFDGKVHIGELVVHKKVASEVLEIFKELFEKKFPIERIRRIEAYKGDDDDSMADNNTSAFNCRKIKGSKTKLSKHSYGLAIDINPLINPYIKNGKVLPREGVKYLDRKKSVPGIIVKGGSCYSAFIKRGWQWGGQWKSMKDYQHFEKNIHYITHTNR